MSKREFTIANEYHYDRTTPIRWIISHLLRYKPFMGSFMLASIITNMFYASVPLFTGMAFNAVLQGTAAASQLLRIVLLILGVVVLGGIVDLSARLSTEILGKRLATDARDELYVNLLGKSQTFHNRQRVGDIMARAANDMNQLSNMIVPGVDTVFDSFTSLFITLIFIGFIQPQLLLTPLLYTIIFIITLRHYSRQLQPVSDEMRDQFGKMNAVLTETVSGIEVVKSTAQESQEQRKFARHARLYRDFFIKNGEIQARYL
ncbi:MAG TPA: ABC transporter ATP-binding protein, partial [Ktedonobacter sp.]|nr:ABC transporter ATP-binding protein [Ktedonobacter sp.]